MCGDGECVHRVGCRMHHRFRGTGNDDTRICQNKINKLIRSNFVNDCLVSQLVRNVGDTINKCYGYDDF